MEKWAIGALTAEELNIAPRSKHKLGSLREGAQWLEEGPGRLEILKLPTYPQESRSLYL